VRKPEVKNHCGDPGVDGWIILRWGRGEAYRGFWWGNLMERDHLACVYGRIILRWIFGK
jgi:hypothetical protein